MLGEYRPCCKLDINQSEFSGKKNYSWPRTDPGTWVNSEYSQYLKKNLAQGNKLPECHGCWYEESHGITSTRQHINKTVASNQVDLEKSWVSLFFKKKQDYTSDLLLATDVKLSNLCNFSCIMCSPWNSTKIYAEWAKNPEHPAIKPQLKDNPLILKEAKTIAGQISNHELLQKIIELKIRFIRILGGEPLMDNKALDILASAPNDFKSQTTLMFVTNGSVDLCETKQKFSDYKEIIFGLSLEGIGQVQDWIRKGSKWALIERNVKQYIQQYPGHLIYIMHTLQALSAYHLPDLIKWCNENKLPLALTVLRDPKHLSIEILPSLLKDEICARFRTMSSELSRELLDDESSIKDLNSLISAVTEAGCHQNLRSQFWQYVDWYDPDQQWREIFPEWINYRD